MQVSEDDVIVVGAPLPRLVSVIPGEGHTLVVQFEGEEGTRIADLETVVRPFKVFAPIRDNERRWMRVRLINHGTAIAWGEEGDPSYCDMAATTVARLSGYRR